MKPEKIIEVKPVHGGWKVFEMHGVEPVFGGDNGRQQAIGYAKTRQGFSHGKIQVYDQAGNLVETIPFDEREKRL